jgi:hypothetical protein
VGPSPEVAAAGELPGDRMVAGHPQEWDALLLILSRIRGQRDRISRRRGNATSDP